MKKTKMIFLHGKGCASSNELYAPVKQLAEHMGAELFCIDAPNPHREKGNRWHNGNKQPIEEAIVEFNKSIEHIETETHKIVGADKIPNDIIWAGQSQGGDMAMRMALKYGAKNVVVWGADISPSFPLPENPHTDFIINWLQAEEDDTLNESRLQSYEKLIGIGVGLNYKIIPGTTHTNWSVGQLISELKI